MKKLILPLLILVSFGSNAQLRGVLKDKMNEKLKTKTNNSNTTENANTNTTTTTTETSGTNNSTNTTTNSTNTTTDPNAGGQNTNYNAGQQYPGFSMGGKKEIRPKYNFKSNILMEMRPYDKKGNLEADKVAQMRWQLSDEPYTGFEMTDKKDKAKIAFSITEADKNQLVMLMENDGQKVAMVRKVEPAKTQSSQNGASGSGEKKPTITKTGRTKTILNYNCEEWISTDEKGEKTEMWVTKDIAVDLSQTWAMYAKNDKQMAQSMGSTEYPQGFMMEMTHYDTDGEKFVMVTLEVNLNAPKTVDTAGYVVY
ncbi:MAG TPA: hypothetical protein VD905_11435 [Flavobacteriales bacterium]|nr:hypothetical protein [Flavobacteriales bacterium]